MKMAKSVNEMTLKEKYDANVEFVNKLRFYCKNHNCKQSVPFDASKCDLSKCECCTEEISFDNFEKIMEYEPPVDWSKVPVDAKIYVRDNEDITWQKRHFSKYRDGRVYAFFGGKTSFTAYHDDDDRSWRHAKLAEEDV